MPFSFVPSRNALSVSGCVGGSGSFSRLQALTARTNASSSATIAQRLMI